MYYADILLHLYMGNQILHGIAKVCGFVLRTYGFVIWKVICCAITDHVRCKVLKTPCNGIPQHPLTFYNFLSRNIFDSVS